MAGPRLEQCSLRRWDAESSGCPANGGGRAGAVRGAGREGAMRGLLGGWTGDRAGLQVEMGPAEKGSHLSGARQPCGQMGGGS